MLTLRTKKRTAHEIAAEIVSRAKDQGVAASSLEPDCHEGLIGLGQVEIEVELESEQRLEVAVNGYDLPEKWETHYLDIYEPSRVARVRIKNGAPRYSNKLGLLPPDLETQKCCLRIEMKPATPGGALAIWNIALQFLAMPGCQVAEKFGTRIPLTDGTTTWLNFDGERYWVESDGQKPVEKLLPAGIEFRGYEKSHIALGPPSLYDKESFSATLWSNIDATSRSSKGNINTSAAVEKAALLSSTEVKPSLVEENLRRVAHFIWETRSAEFTSTEQIRYLYSSIASLVNDGIVENPLQLRSWNVAYNDLDASVLPGRLEKFFTDLLNKYTRTVAGSLSPAELSLWIEWEFDREIHPLADGCGRVGKALAAYFLARFNQAQPDYGSRQEYYDAMNTGYQTFKRYYHSAIKRGANKLSLR